MHKMRYSYITMLLLLLTGCASSLYDHFTFTETLETKVQAEALVQNASQPIAEFRPQIDQLQQQIDKMVLYETAKSKNPITLQMWKLLDKEDSALQQFLLLWEKQGTLSPAFTKEYSLQLKNIFQLMIDYETKKDKSTEGALLKLLNAA